MEGTKNGTEMTEFLKLRFGGWSPKRRARQAANPSIRPAILLAAMLIFSYDPMEVATTKKKASKAAGAAGPPNALRLVLPSLASFLLPEQVVPLGLTCTAFHKYLIEIIHFHDFDIISETLQCCCLSFDGDESFLLPRPMFCPSADPHFRIRHDNYLYYCH